MKNVVRKPADRVGEKYDALRMLPQVSDLPSHGWRLREERTWPTQSTGEDWAVRSAEVNSITAWRYFDNKVTDETLWIQVTPCANVEDAPVAMATICKWFLTKLGWHLVVRPAQRVNDLEVPGTEHICAFEQDTEHVYGLGIARYLAFSVDRVVVVMAVTGIANAWRWNKVLALAHQEVDRISAASKAD